MLSFSNYTYYAPQTHAYAFENVPLVARTIAVRTYINLKGEKNAFSSISVFNENYKKLLKSASIRLDS